MTPKSAVKMGISINWGTPMADWFIMENPTKIDDFVGTPILGNHHIMGVVLSLCNHCCDWAASCKVAWADARAKAKV